MVRIDIAASKNKKVHKKKVDELFEIIFTILNLAF